MPCFCFKLPSHQQGKFQVLILLFKVILVSWVFLQLPLSLQSVAVPTAGEKAWHRGRGFPAAAEIYCAQLMRNHNKNKSLLLFSEQSINRKITHRTPVFGIRTGSGVCRNSQLVWNQPAWGAGSSRTVVATEPCTSLLILLTGLGCFWYLNQLTEYLKEKIGKNSIA